MNASPVPDNIMYDRRNLADATAVILAGGKSSRMGRPKALLPFGGEPLIAHIVRDLKRIFAEAVVVAAPDQELPSLPVTLVRDEVAYQGPVGGIYYGLKAATKEVSFVTSCDAPFLSPALIEHLLSQIPDWDVVVPYCQDRFQPLHAVYRKSVLPLLKEQLERGELRPVFLYDKVRTRKIQEDELRRFDPEGMSFLNMNTAEDYEAAMGRWHRRHAESQAGRMCNVELFGVARLLAKTKQLELPLTPEATLAQVLSAMAQRLPVLVGRVIGPDRQSLCSGYACNLNGLEFVRDPTGTKIRPGDKILIVSADAGG